MARRRRPVPGINAGSMADVAFLLLIFFLAVTTMDSETGILRQLPPLPDPDMPEELYKINDRNILVVKVNKDNQLLVGGHLTEFSQLREITSRFIVNENNLPDMPEREMMTLPYLGTVAVTKAVISLQNDISTSYGTYITVQNEMIAARAELRDKLSREKFGRPYDKLDEARRRAVDEYYKVPISEAEPIRTGVE